MSWVVVVLIICNIVSVLAALAAVGLVIWRLTENWRLFRIVRKMGIDTSKYEK